MKSLRSNINTKSAAFKDNAAAMAELVNKLEKHLVESRFEGKDKHVEKARKRKNSEDDSGYKILGTSPSINSSNSYYEYLKTRAV